MHESDSNSSIELGAVALAIAVAAASAIYRPPPPRAANLQVSRERSSVGTQMHATNGPTATMAAQANTSSTVASATALKISGITSTASANAPLGSAAPTVISRAAVITPSIAAPAEGTAPIDAGEAPAGTTTTADSGTLVDPTPNGPEDPPPPYFSYRRPFDPPDESAPSRFYPYGTTAHGAYLLHHGVDLSNPMGTPVRAIGEGEVIYAGSDLDSVWGEFTNFYGNLVVIRHPEEVDGQPVYSLYGHLSQVIAVARQHVPAGEVIGLVGSAGIAMGPHLHLEYRTEAQNYESTRNIELMLRPLPGHGTIVGRLQDASGQPILSEDVGLYQVLPSGQENWVGGMETYPGVHVNSTPYWGENFLFPDTPVGRYVVSAVANGTLVWAPVEVADGKVYRVTLSAN